MLYRQPIFKITTRVAARIEFDLSKMGDSDEILASTQRLVNAMSKTRVPQREICNLGDLLGSAFCLEEGVDCNLSGALDRG